MGDQDPTSRKDLDESLFKEEKDDVPSSSSDPSRLLLDLISLQTATRSATDKAQKARQGYESQREHNQVLLEYVDNLIQAVYPEQNSNGSSASPSASSSSPYSPM